MKKGVLVLMFLALVSASFAQTKKKTTAKSKKAPAKTTTKTAANSAVKTNTPVTSTPPNTAVTGVTETALADTKTTAAAPLDLPIDGYYKKTNTLAAQPIAYASLRQADVVFAKRIWREIDLREKMNQYLASPKARLIDILVDAIKNDELRAFDPTPTKEHPSGDDFAVPLTSQQAMLKLADSVLVTKTDANGDKGETKMMAGEFNPDSIVRFRIKEDWIFDKQRSVYEPRIVGIAPLVQIKIAGSSADYQPIFWIYFPEARPILAAREIVRKNNDASALNFDQAFLKRIFTSYIVKESNEKDERIKDYAQGIDRLYESERIKKSLLDWELNLWQY